MPPEAAAAQAGDASVRHLPSTGDDRLSVLGRLAERREEIRAAATTVLPVPRWVDPVIKVRFKPVDHGIIRKGQTSAENAKGAQRSEAEVNANIDVLIAGCVEVFAEIDGKPYSLLPGEPDGLKTRFDVDLARSLGCTPAARDVVRALYLFEGDIISTASAIGEFSGYREQEADEAIQGE